MATLFSYFTKSPKVGATAGKKSNASPKEQAKELKEKNGSTPIGPKSPVFNVQSHGEGEIVWAKMEGHPWWPSMICKHPSTSKLEKKVGKFIELHVQFFGTPPSRGWIKKRDLQGINDRKPDDNEEVKSAYKEALEAVKLKSNERIEKLYACASSDEEMDENDEEDGKISFEIGNSVENNGEVIMSADEEDDVNQKVPKSEKRKRTRRDNEKEQRKKAKRVIESGSESEDEYKPDGEESSDDGASSGVNEDELSGVEAEEISDDEEDGGSKTKKKLAASKSFLTPIRSKKNGKENLNNTGTPKSTSPLMEKVASSVNRAQTALAKFSAEPSSPAPDIGTGEVRTFDHEKLQFLKDGHRKDKNGKLHTDPNYDKKTLLIPDSFLKSKEVTPALRQWWYLKRDLYDTILFFKLGKFYELYHMDAVVGVKELGLLFMRGKAAHCGFPEIAFSRYSDILVQRGYKVARVEQTETPQMMNERCAKKAGTPKVVARELVAVTSKGTKTYSYMEGQAVDSESSFLFAFCEKNDGGSESTFGVCFLDTSIGKFHIGQFKDDRQSSRFRTLLSHYPPAEVLYERGGLSTKTQSILQHELVSTLKEALVPGTEFWDSGKTLKQLAEHNWFDDSLSSENSTKSWPPVIKKMLSNADTLGLTASDEYSLAISALGACTWYLKKCLIEEELLSMGQFEEYIPVDNLSPSSEVSSFPEKRQKLILDGVTLANLDIVCNGDGGIEGSLLEQLDHCSTPFGKRLLKQWLCAPLCHPDGINARLDAVEELMGKSSLMEKAGEIMRTIPDLERILRRIHAMGSLKKSKIHPESRQILFNNDVYNKRKIGDLLSALEGLEKASKVVALFQSDDEPLKSSLLQQIVSKQEGRSSKGFPDLSEFLDFFKNAFDHNKAKKDGVILPKKGVHEEYDRALEDINAVERDLDDYLEKQRKRLGCRAITYWGNGKFRYQLEVPEKNLARNTPDDYHLKSQRKGYKRFRTDYIEEKLLELCDAEDRRDSALKDTMRNVFHIFDEKYKSMEGALQCISVLDCLMSLAIYSSNADGVTCRPEILLTSTHEGNENVTPFIEIRNSRHPCISRTFTGDDFIPNDINVGKMQGDEGEANSDSTCLLVTGPNMGGKSTLMRQTGIIIIMAQLGCYVPAEMCRFTPVDRVFTRLGAHDRILHGESTFFVELSETATILQHSTRNSLVLLDELGRGTATFDGTAIASAVVRELAHSIKCRTLFSTHYHSLVDEFSDDPSITLGHMACMVENDDENSSGDPSTETITFLYKLASGPCPKSYGFNAARLAGLPIEIIKCAYLKARMLEDVTMKSRIFRSVVSQNHQIDEKLVAEIRKHIERA
ncbi:DNA mismatch repair protein Msh6-like [Rhopilema esculentum]|uniref:DNA mismatch repair protein Msh6-like n=1 Tax=Rhopilema esculentum TaxID=499914 RepID=UPI0031D0462C|eukprot:gene8532-14533_t